MGSPKSSLASSAWRAYWTVRLGLALVFVVLAGFGACFSVLSH
jgi:hypothetical protein